MKFFVVCVLAAAYFAGPCYSEPFIMELPGYAKTVMGAYGINVIAIALISQIIPTDVASKNFCRKP